MKSLHEIVKILNEYKEELARKYKIKEMRIFGSYVKGKQKDSSDVDIIVEFEEIPTFVEFIRLQEELNELLDMKVDLLTEESISPFIKPYIKESLTIWKL